MEKREVKGHYGAKFVLFQCPECSGIWVDPDVIFAISRDSAVGVEVEVSFDEVPRQPRDEPRLCPRCAVSLTEETGEGIPQGLRIDLCPACRGFWFDKGELMIYKSYLEEKRQKFKKREAESQRRREKVQREIRGKERALSLQVADNWRYRSLGSVVARVLIGLMK
ncbi:MAG: zf-TFIIB domain-containing protein [Candidatus Lindowbacteria bacterium]|nr:zf-TFIIB domain-containing protein [Candidatus Lindowbacteria bacterium]